MTNPVISQEVIRNIGKEIGNVLLDGVHKDFQDLRHDLPKLIKSVVHEEFDSVGLNPRDPYARRAEFDFLKKMYKDWGEFDKSIREIVDLWTMNKRDILDYEQMLREWREEKESAKEAKQSLKNWLLITGAAIALAAILMSIFHVDLSTYIKP